MNAPAEDWVIEAEGLGRRYGQRAVLSGLDLKIRRGEVFGLLGSDGAGKTTTLQILAGILDPSAGHATVLGYDSVRETGEITSRIGYMSQVFSLYGRLTVDENLGFFADLYGVAPAAREAAAPAGPSAPAGEPAEKIGTAESTRGVSEAGAFSLPAPAHPGDSAKNRVAHSTKKNLLLAIVDEEEVITYYEVRWLRP